MEAILAIPKLDYTPEPVYGLGTTAGLPDYNPPAPAGLTFDYAVTIVLELLQAWGKLVANGK